MPIKKKSVSLKNLVLAISLIVSIVVGVSKAAEKSVKFTGTFSNLEFNKEGGDLNGVEIKIVVVKTGYQGALQIAEGGPSQIMVVDVHIDGEKIEFEIPQIYSVYGGQSFTGKIEKKGITGAFSLKGKKMDQEILIRKHSYWD